MQMLFPLGLTQGMPLSSETAPIFLGVLIVVILIGFFLILARRYKRCPSNKILVIYGRTSKGQTAKTLHGGGTFVWPLIQSYDYIALDPIQIEIPLQGALSLENIRVSVPSVFTVAVGTEPGVMNNAAVRLLDLSRGEIMKQAEDIIFGQLRQVIASMKIEEINKDRDVFLSKVQASLEPELAKIGLVLINVNIKDITDESGYIEAIGRKAASEAINQAEIDVAKQEQLGAVGVSEAEKVRYIQVAELEKVRDVGTKAAERDRAVEIAEMERDRIIGEKKAEFLRDTAVRDAQREMRIQVADADAKAVKGENEAKAVIAQTNADLQVQEANAFQLGETRQREAHAAVLEAEYLAQAKAAAAQAKKIEAEKRAELEASALAEKAQTIVDAQASAEKARIVAEGDAAAQFARLEAEARGQYEILAKKGQGLRAIIESCGGADQAFRMMMLEHIDHIAETASKAIANIKFDKIVVWDGAGGANGQGGNGTSRFLQGLAGSLPPALQMMKDIGGVEMPEYFGKLVDQEALDAADDDDKSVAAAKKAAAKKDAEGGNPGKSDPPKPGSSGRPNHPRP